jgi:hypothetical protein
MIHPLTEVRYISAEKGYGVVAKQPIPKGTITWVMDKLDRVFTPIEIATIGADYQPIIATYCFIDAQGNYVLCWDNERYINHSFNANCITTAYDFTIAVRNIEQEEEITNDYGFLNVNNSFDCAREANSDRTKVDPNDFLTCFKKWDEQVAEAFVLIPKVEQPLMKWLPKNVQQKIADVVENGAAIDSVITCYHKIIDNNV